MRQRGQNYSAIRIHTTTYKALKKAAIDADSSCIDLIDRLLDVYIRQEKERAARRLQEKTQSKQAEQRGVC